jgi:hypothetical protein
MCAGVSGEWCGEKRIRGQKVGDGTALRVAQLPCNKTGGGRGELSIKIVAKTSVGGQTDGITGAT